MSISFQENQLDNNVAKFDKLNLSDNSFDEDVKNSSALEDDYVNSLEWKEKKKHIFILSSAGKPVYSR